MRVTARTFASLRELSADRCELTLAEGATLEDAWDALAAQFAAITVHRPFVRAARNGAYAGWADALADGDEVAFLPPVSGGSSGLTTDAIDVAALEHATADLEHGAVVTFVGRARRRGDDGREVTELEYEVYPEMAASVLDEIANEAEGRWGARVAVVHRHGLVPLGEAAVAIVTAAAHRGEAYEANRFVIEAIKERLPIWKRERFVDGSEWKRPGA
ncbi:MAG TPA: molybdenum cofactor biosynthesis protein MoaE [Candidatus Limnocylindria bacterium]